MIKKISLAVIAIVIGLIAAAEIFTDSSGFNFNIISEDDATVEFAPGNYSGKRLTSSGLSTVSYNGKTYNIVAFGKECFKNQQPIIGTGTAWFDAGIAYIDSAAFEGTTIISSNEATVGGANTLGLRANPITWHPKAFVGNMLGNFQPINDTRFLNISETQALGMQHRGVLMSRDKTTVYVFPGDKRNGTNRSAGVLSSYAFLAQVTTVADYAFSGNSKLTSVNFSSCQVATIGEEAFSHSVLTSFTVPATVTTLGPGFIAGNKKISSIGVASGNTAYKSVDGMVYTIDDATLVAVPAKTTELTIPEGVTAIAAKADLDGSLTEVTIPSTVASIGVDAFVGNPNITSVYCNAVNPPSRGMFDDAVYSGATLVLPAGANKAAYEADPDWGKFANIQQLGGGVPTDPFKDGNLWYKPTSDSTVTIIPNQEADNYTGVQSSWFETSVRHALGYTFTVTAIADSAFMNATVNGAISNIPVTVTSIGVDAFYGANVTTLTIPANVTSLGDGFATNNKSLTAITVADGNTAYKSIDGNVYTIDGETLVAVAGAKTALTVADNTITIAPRADYNGSLNTLALPASLTTIGENAFVGNSAITAIASNATVPPTGAVFDQVVYDNVVPVIPEGSQSAYEADANWKKFFPDYVRPTEPFQVGNLWYQAIDDDNVVIVGNPDGAYTGVAAAWFVENITYNKTHNFTVTAIADSAFAGATITGIAIPATIATIGNYAFDGSNIASLTIPATVTSLGEGVIARTTSLNAVSV
ncbi:MAG: leucine-rich repeat protein, partial [Bacteroidales bacterium]|nr:leucine-rich repeat protein [Candidatus Sodaliphilus aphodohippi]